MKNFRNKKAPAFDVETLKLAMAGVSLVSGLMGAIYFYTLNIPIYITGVFFICVLLVHLPLFMKKEGGG